MRRAEVFGLRWSQVDLEAMTLRVEETKTGEPLEFPVTRQLAAFFASVVNAGAAAPSPSRALRTLLVLRLAMFAIASRLRRARPGRLRRHRASPRPGR